MDILIKNLTPASLTEMKETLDLSTENPKHCGSRSVTARNSRTERWIVKIRDRWPFHEKGK